MCLYIYACDDELRRQLKKCTGNYLEYKIDKDEEGIEWLKVSEESTEYK